MAESQPAAIAIQLLYHQTLAFVFAWCAAFLFGHRLRRSHWLLSLIYLTAIETGALAILRAAGEPGPGNPGWIALALIAVVIIALSENWNPTGQAALAVTVSLSAVFVVHIVGVTASSHLGLVSLVFSSGLVALQAFALLLLCASSYEILDVLCRARWMTKNEPAPPSPGYAPRVSIHVPAYNEPPEMVKETLDALARLDYPNYEVIVIDDNTTDEKLWRPIEAHCARLGFRFYHLENWPGFKSGALNFALRETDPEAEIVGVVDSDYVVAPEWLRECVGFFQDPSTGFVQSPQDYRDLPPGDRYALACYHAYLYFFKVSMASRSQHNGIIFAGTMGLVRRSALVEAGGWDEWCITEDAELSLRLLDRGARGQYVDRSYGRGLMPFNFEGLKKQRFRWAFGGMQIMRLHWMRLMPWTRRREGRGLTWRQRWDYLLGGLQWLNDPATFGFTVLLFLGAASLLVARSLFIQPLAGAVLFVPFLFVFMGVSRFLWALRHRVGCTFAEARAAFTMLLALTWVVTLACVLGLTREKGVFLRTPKTRPGRPGWNAYRVVSQETIIAGFCLACAAALSLQFPHVPYVWLMVALLIWQSIIYSSALRASFWSVASEARLAHPEYRMSPQTTGQRISSMISDRRVVRGLVLASAVLAVVFFLAVRFAPEEERAFRNNPEGKPLLAAELVTSTAPEAQIKGLIYLEGRSALHSSVDDALRLWSPDGVIRDENYTPHDSTDDRVWAGAPAIRERYRAEFAQRHYLKLAHTDASVVVEGDRATVVNDLRAEILTAEGVQRVFLSRGDRWTFRKGENGWRIAELVVNRAPR